MPPVTFVIPGNGTSVLAGAIPLGYDVAVQSVVATIDNSVGAADPVELIVSDPSGEVIATHAQDDAIAAGATGFATWALRLAAAQTGKGAIRFDVNNGQGEVHRLYIEADNPVGMSFITNPAIPLTGLGYSFFAGNQAFNGGFTFTADHGAFNVQTGGSVNLFSTGVDPGSAVTVGTGSGTGAPIDINADGDVTISADGNATGLYNIVLQNLPVVNPGRPGALWNNGGVVNIS